MIALESSAEGHIAFSDLRLNLERVVAGLELNGKRVLIIIPDDTRSGPIDSFFKLLHELLGAQTAALDFMIALGTHQPMTLPAICRHLQIEPGELTQRYAGTRIFNHEWMIPDMLVRLGEIPAAEIGELSQGLFEKALPVSINRKIHDYDQLIICGPVFPHEVAGFSGGNKYFFPGISGNEIIDFSHWLGALLTSYKIIGTKHTPVRDIIDRAADLIQKPKLSICYVVKNGNLKGLFAGNPKEAWSRAADLSKTVHIRYVDRPFQRVLSVMPAMYKDLWTAAKGMYKLEPVVADNGELIIYAPEITEISYSHGKIIDEIGYHTKGYFLADWDKFRSYPWGVLAHSTHLRGCGEMVHGEEKPRIQVTLATGIPAERCRQVGLGYMNPDRIAPAEWTRREREGILVVPKAGEILYRLKGES